MNTSISTKHSIDYGSLDDDQKKEYKELRKQRKEDGGLEGKDLKRYKHLRKIKNTPKVSASEELRKLRDLFSSGGPNVLKKRENLLPSGYDHAWAMRDKALVDAWWGEEQSKPKPKRLPPVGTEARFASERLRRYELKLIANSDEQGEDLNAEESDEDGADNDERAGAVVAA